MQLYFLIVSPSLSGVHTLVKNNSDIKENTYIIENNVNWDGTLKSEILTFNNYKFLSQSFVIKGYETTSSIIENGGVYKLNSNGKMASLIEHHKKLDSDTIYMKAVINEFKSMLLFDAVLKIQWETEKNKN